MAEEEKDPRYEIRDKEIEETLRRLAQAINVSCPPGYGFALQIFGYENHAFFWISNANRQDMCKALREFIKREEAN